MNSPATPTLPPIPAALAGAADRVDAAVRLLRDLVTVGTDPHGAGNTATLIDGSVVSSSSEEWRAECFNRSADARGVLDLPHREARAQRVAWIATTAGAEAARRLEAAVLVLWASRTLVLAGRPDDAAAIAALRLDVLARPDGGAP